MSSRSTRLPARQNPAFALTLSAAVVLAGTVVRGQATKEARARERGERDRAEREQRKSAKARKTMEAEIAALEKHLAELTAALEDDSAKGDHAALRQASGEYGIARAKLDAVLARWVESGE